MSKGLKTFIVIAILIILVSAGLIIYAGSKHKQNDQTNSGENGNVAGASTSDSSDNSNGTNNADYVVKLAKYLSEKGMVMYGAYWCSHCKEQKDEFGDAFQYVDYVECDAQGPNANPDECQAKGIEGYPTWIYQGVKYTGAQSLAKLAEIVGFSE